jgi:hypothetical protein
MFLDDAIVHGNNEEGGRACIMSADTHEENTKRSVLTLTGTFLFFRGGANRAIIMNEKRRRRRESHNAGRSLQRRTHPPA